MQQKKPEKVLEFEEVTNILENLQRLKPGDLEKIQQLNLGILEKLVDTEESRKVVTKEKYSQC